MTVEQFKKNLARLSYLDHNGPSEEYYALRDSMIADYELLEGEYKDWSALALAWFKWALANEDEITHRLPDPTIKELHELIDRTIINVG